NRHDNGLRMFCQLRVSSSGSIVPHVAPPSVFVATLRVSIVHLPLPVSCKVTRSMMPQTPSGPSRLTHRLAASRSRSNVLPERLGVMGQGPGAIAELAG